MNPKVMMVVALCAACVATTAFAEDDFGIESASPVAIADPVNPQPGMMLRTYRLDKFMKAEDLKSSISKLPSRPAAKTLVDKEEEFSLKQFGKSDAQVGMWAGFMKCKLTGVYTLTLVQPTKSRIPAGMGGYSLRINGKVAIAAGWRETSVDVNLKAGLNKVELVCQFGKAPALSISYKPKDSTSDARPIGPKDLYHDQKPEEEW